MNAPLLLPYQQRWIADQAEVKVAEKSRRIGLSWADACGAVMEGAPAQGWRDTWYIGYTKDMAEQYILDAGNWAKAMNVAVEAIEDAEDVLDEEDKGAIKAFRVKLRSGARITALSSRPRNLRSKKGRVTIDEAAFHDDLAELLKAALALLVWGNSQISIISTHDGAENPFNELIGEIRAGKWPYSLHTITIDDAIRDGLYGRICERQGKIWTPGGEAEWRQKIFDLYGEAADEELRCIPRRSGGAYLPRSLVESRMAPELPVIRKEFPDGFVGRPEVDRVLEVDRWLQEVMAPLLAELDPQLRHGFGMDFGRSGDLSVFAPIEEERDLSATIPWVLELRNAPHETQKQIVFYLVSRLPRFLSGVMDATGNGSFLAETTAQKFGDHAIEQLKLNEAWHRDNWPRYKADMQDGMITLPKDADLLDDHRAVVVIDGVPKLAKARTAGADKKKRHGDGAMACCLANYARRRNVAPIEYLSLGQTRIGYGLADFLGG